MKETAELGKQLAHVMKAIQEAEADFTDTRNEHKKNMENLHRTAYSLAEEIRTGQRRLPVEPPEQPKAKGKAAAAGKD